ncbi:MAG: hypothetical protein Q7J12_09290 [Syntrophales bacterium]|nr:hypothetical protein [Syntrophales bacterium]
MAVVAPISGKELTAQEVIEYCKGKMASYKKPKCVEFVEALPRNPTGKALKTVLREKYGKSNATEPAALSQRSNQRIEEGEYAFSTYRRTGNV